MKRFKNLAVTIAMLLVCVVQASATNVTFEDWTSTNHADGSTDSKTYTFYTEKISALRFDWSVSSEGCCDKLRVTLDGNSILERGGNLNGSYVSDAFGKGQHVLVVSYSKDGSVNSGSDQATVSNIEVFEKEVISRDGLEYIANGSSVVSVVGVSNIAKNIVIPSTIATDSMVYNVTAVNDGAFSGCKNLVSITIPASITNIGNAVFGECTGLKEVIFEDGGEVLSLGCNLCGIYTENGSTWYSQGKGLFYDSPIETLYLGRDLNYNNDWEYGYSPFYSKKTLTSVTIGDSVTNMRNNTFSDCSNLSSVRISSLEAWCNINFDGNSANPLYYAKHLYANGELVTDLTIPSTVTEVKRYAFYNCGSLTSITIPNNITNIGSYAFGECVGLTSIRIPESVISIDGSAFANCGFSAITVAEGNMNYDSRDGCNAIIETNANKLILGSSSTVIPNSITSIGDNAFRGCTDLTSIILPDSLTSIGNYAFYNCSSLTSINIPESVTSIGQDAFYGCSELTTVVIPEGTTEIQNYAFYNCKNLTSIIIPETVTRIGNYAFADCSNLTSVNIPKSVTSIGYDAFRNCSSLSSVHIVDIADWCNIDFGSYTSNPLYYGKKLYLNRELITELSIPNTVTEIKNNVFAGCGELVSVSLPESITSIGSYAFCDCGNLASINLSRNITSIGNNAFHNCISLTSIKLPETVTSVGDNAFYNCSSLTSITLPGNVTSVGYGVFEGCSNLASVTFGSCINVYSNILRGFQGELMVHCNIPDETFIDCSFTKIVVGANVKSIGNKAFYNCTNLREVVFEDSYTPISLGYNMEGVYNGDYGYYETLGQGLFHDCPIETLYLGRNITFDQGEGVGYSPFYENTTLKSITIGDGLTEMYGWNIFGGCSNLASINIGSIETWLGINFHNADSNPLYYAKNLYLNGELVTDLVIPNTVTEINNYVFYGCASLESVTIPESVQRINYDAFGECNSLTSVNIGDLDSWCNINFNSSTANPLTYAKNLYLNGELVKELSIPNSIKSIKNYSFSGFCGSIIVPASVTSIGYGAFLNGGIEVTMESATPPTLNSSSVISSNGMFIVPDSAFSAYQTAKYWSELIGNMSSSGAHKKEVTLVAMSKQSALHQALGDAALPYVVDLTINGTINSYDFMVMLNKMNRLRRLDLTNAHIVYNGYEHYTGCHSENNKLPAYAFYKKDLASVKLPQDITAIGEYAFSNCEGLTSLVVPECVTSVGNYTFSSSSLADVVFEGTTSIGERAFSYCSNLKKVSLERGGLIGSYAFYGCWNLANVVLEEGGSIGYYAFSGCSGLRGIELKGLVSIGNYAFSDCSSLASLNISEGISLIGSYAFSGCRILQNLIIPNISGPIDSYAFNNCSNLASLTILNGSTSIGSRAFCGCSNLKVVSLDEVSSVGSYAFGQSNSYPYNGECRNLTSITILKGLKTIGERAFYNCTSLKEVAFPAGLTTIGAYAFYNCDGLKEMNVPDGVTTIGEGAFSNCSNLESMKLPTTLQTINSSAFSSCSRLAEVHIPGSVRNIYDNAFSGCANMKKVYVYTIEPTAINQNTFAKNSNNNFYGTLYAPKVSYYVYWYDTQWSQFEDIKPFDEPYDNFYLKGDLELNDSTGVVQGNEGEKPDAELGSNSGLVTDGNIDQELGDVEIEHDGTNGGSIIAGGNSSVEVDNLTFRITVTGGRWYFFCFPFDVRREDIKCENGADWVFRYYDGEERASNGKGGWKNVTSDGNGNHLKAATGYIFQCSKNDVLVLSAKNQKIKQEKKYNELVEHVTANMQDASWNFVGNPYLSYYDITGDDYSAPITIWDGSKYVAIRPGDDDYVLSPFEAFFVQKPEGVNDIEYDPEQQMTYYQMRMAAEQKAARRRTQTINPDRLLVNLTLSDTATTDRTRVVFNNEVSLDYEMDCDAAKFTTAGVPQIYTVGNRAVKYAINERPIAEGIVTVGYTAPVQGNYTLAAPRMDVSVYIKDNRTGILHDLSEGSYTFMTEAGTFEDRFVLMMKDDATSIDKSQLINDEEAPIYNTKGQWVDEPSNQGVYIKDNRKVVKL